MSLVINTINSAANAIIPLGINASAGTKVKITAFGLETAEHIYLEDRFKGKLISLAENSTYNFDLQSDVILNRFFIRFGDMNTALTTSDIIVLFSE